MDRLEQAFARFDALNRESPPGPSGLPAELCYSLRMTAWLSRGWPDASEALRLAVRAQHLARHRTPRAAYPEGRDGYRAWRKAAARRHAELATEVLLEVGYDLAFAERVASLIRKERFKVDPEAQALEDVACLVFVEHELRPFAATQEESKVVTIIAKTWPKMSAYAQSLAGSLELDPDAAALVRRAIALATTDPAPPDDA